MIKFQALMQAIQQSIHNASKAIEEQGKNYVHDYFDKIEDANSDGGEFSGSFRPKMVEMEFPSRTAEGLETVTANVPLITLSPISSPKISEVKFTARLEVTTDEQGELYVAFPSAKKGGVFSRSSVSKHENTRIEITLTGAEPPEGLQKVIEGYERAIRAQIPG